MTENGKERDPMITPGPWSVYEVKDGDEVIARGVKGADGKSINHGEDCELFEVDDANVMAAAWDFYTAAASMIARHDEKARAANFTYCGCDDCTPFRAIVAKGESQ